MPKYVVYLHTTASTSVEVEADDEEAAIDAAYDGELPTLCAQCSGWVRKWSLDLGDEWVVSEDRDTDGNVTFSGVEPA